MSSLISVTNDAVVVAKQNCIKVLDLNSQCDELTTIVMPRSGLNNSTEDNISDICASDDFKYFAILFSFSKRLVIICKEGYKIVKEQTLPRAASKIRFTPDGQNVLIADKTGDALLYPIDAENEPPRKLFGHLSLLLDILMTDDKEFIITCDRDEKIRITNNPHTHNIHCYCLGHKEFVKCLEFLPFDKNYIVSASGDGTIRIWDYKIGHCCHIIDTKLEFQGRSDVRGFIDSMDKDAVEVSCLPITYLAVANIDSTSSLIAVSIHKINCILLVKLFKEDVIIKHSLIHKLEVDMVPSHFKFKDLNLFVCFDLEKHTLFQTYQVKVNNEIFVQPCKKIEIFEDLDSIATQQIDEQISVLYKRKFDNVQEYLERKRQRIKAHQ